MGKELKVRSFRIEDGVWEAVQGHELSANQLLKMALGLDHVVTKVLASPNFEVKLPEQSVEGKFPCRCVHSGCGGANFKGFTKYANLCSGCRETGHRSNPAECPECNAGGAL